MAALALSSLMAESFHELLARARAGEASALAELVRQCEHEVRIVARVQLGPALRPHLDSIDLVQSVHKSLLLGLRDNRFEIVSPEKLIALALTIVRRKVARKWRQLRRQQQLSHGPSGATPLPDLLAELQSSEPDPARIAQIEETSRRACAALSHVERRLLELRLQGLSTAAAARELNEDSDVTRVRLSRLRRSLIELGLMSNWL